MIFPFFQSHYININIYISRQKCSYIYIYVHIYVYRRTIILGVCWNCTFDMYSIFYHVDKEFFIKYTYTYSRYIRSSIFRSLCQIIFIPNEKLTRLVWRVRLKTQLFTDEKLMSRHIGLFYQNQRELLYFLCEWKENSFVVLQSIDASIDGPEFALHYTVYQEEPHLIS